MYGLIYVYTHYNIQLDFFHYDVNIVYPIIEKKNLFLGVFLVVANFYFFFPNQYSDFCIASLSQGLICMLFVDELVGNWPLKLNFSFLGVIL